MSTHVILTGGASGMGAAAVARLLQREARVTVLDVVEPAEASDYLECDLADPDSIEQVAEQIAQRHPDSLDALVNVAGIAVAPSMQTVVEVNFLGLRHLTERLIPNLRRGAAVVNVASSAGHDWRQNLTNVEALLDTSNFAAGRRWLDDHREAWRDNPYKFSKQCAAAYTHRATGIALPHGVRVNCVHPGAVETRLTPAFRELLGAGVYDWGVARIGRHAQPDDVAEIVEFLALGPCAWLNGAEIAVDGGFLSGLYGGWIERDDAPPG